jgi:endonuclease/exonuclease/phosphatase family metal-dependent hydrolase
MYKACARLGQRLSRCVIAVLDSAMSRRKIIAASALSAVALGAAVCGCSGLMTGAGWFSPSRVQPVSVQCAPDAPPLPRGKQLRVLVWNIQYAAGRQQQFFYDGGQAVSVPEQQVHDTLDQIAAVIERLDPDIILWQEIDRGSRRTHHIDQHRALLDRAPYPCHATTPYHKAPYVPHPGHEHLGKVDMHLGIWSRYRIDTANRFDLARLQESWARQQFNLKRALLTATLPIEGGGAFRLFDTHLSAFSRKDGTLPKQLSQISAEVDKAVASGQPWMLGADLNSLPPGDDPARLGEDQALYEVPSPLASLYDAYTAAIPLEEHSRDPGPWRTYLPFGASVPDRAIDHIFHGGPLRMHGVSVVQDVRDVSDHVPLIFDFELQ